MSSSSDEVDSLSKPSSRNQPLPEEWRSWLRINVVRGCKLEDLIHKCVLEQGFSLRDVQDELALIGGTTSSSRDEKNSENKDCDKKSQGGEEIDKESTVKYVTNSWKEWIQIQLDSNPSNMAMEDVFKKLAIQEQLDLDQVSLAMNGYRARSLVQYSSEQKYPFMKRTFQPRAWKLDTHLVELYEIPSFLTLTECQQVMALIDSSVKQRSVVVSSYEATNGNSSKETRTSRTCHLRLPSQTGTNIDTTSRNNVSIDDDKMNILYDIEDKLQRLIIHDAVGRLESSKIAGVYPNGEPLQGQCYGPGEYFKQHCDWFSEEEYVKHCQIAGGQRTWTCMVYLNSVEEGGQTRFEHIDREYTPQPGLALMWNNLDSASGEPNHFALHEAKPVLKGTKYVLTKWFRERSYYYEPANHHDNTASNDETV